MKEVFNHLNSAAYNLRLDLSQAKRIAIIDWSMIGDLVMLSPCVRAIRSHYPEAYLAIVGQPASIAPYRHDPAVNELIPYDRSKGDYSIPAFRDVLGRLKSGAFDAAFVFHNSIGSALLAWLARIPIRIGYRHEMRDLLLTLRLPRLQERIHLIEEKAKLLEMCGIPVHDLSERIYMDAHSAQRWLLEKLGPNFGRSRPILAVSIGATVEHKRWPPKKLSEMLNMFPVNSVDIVFLGSPSERMLYESVYSYNNTVVDLVGQTTMEELTWVLDRADVYLGPDSGPMHLALGRQRPVVALFGPTDPKRCGPLNNQHATVLRAERICSTCDAKYSSHFRQCLHTMEAKEVFEATDSLLRSTCPRYLKAART